MLFMLPYLKRGCLTVMGVFHSSTEEKLDECSQQYAMFDDFKISFGCNSNRSIFKLETDIPEPKYTIKEVLGQINGIFGEDGKIYINGVNSNIIERQLLLKIDPEYNEYIRLKHKFERLS